MAARPSRRPTRSPAPSSPRADSEEPGFSSLCSDPQMDGSRLSRTCLTFYCVSPRQWVYPSRSVETTSPPFGGLQPPLGGTGRRLSEMVTWYQGKSRGFQIRKTPNSSPFLLGNFWHAA